MIQYDHTGILDHHALHRPFIGASGSHSAFSSHPLEGVVAKTCWTYHQRGGRTALLSGGHMPPCGMPIDSPHESCIRRKRELLRGATAPKPGQGFWMGVLPPQGNPTPSQRNLARACLFATPAF